MHNPGITVQLVLRDSAGTVVGGLLASTTIRIMALEHLWVDVRYRGQGHGRALVTEAERIAQAHGCVASQGTCFSFQTPAFFSAIGYETFGVADLYPDGITENYLIKKFG
jgi:ribosomal protein S18 acetylase RimI-like enzyme